MAKGALKLNVWSNLRLSTPAARTCSEIWMAFDMYTYDKGLLSPAKFGPDRLRGSGWVKGL